MLSYEYFIGTMITLIVTLVFIWLSWRAYKQNEREKQTN